MMLASDSRFSESNGIARMNGNGYLFNLNKVYFNGKKCRNINKRVYCRLYYEWITSHAHQFHWCDTKMYWSFWRPNDRHHIRIDSLLFIRCHQSVILWRAVVFSVFFFGPFITFGCTCTHARASTTIKSIGYKADTNVPRQKNQFKPQNYKNNTRLAMNEIRRRTQAADSQRECGEQQPTKMRTQRNTIRIRCYCGARELCVCEFAEIVSD